MKRSEMVNMMYDKFREEHIVKSETIYVSIEKLLTFMEEQGMQPPQYFGYSSFPQWDREMQEIVLVQRRCLQNVWEPEKEEKDE
jgi:hypothetical protein